MSELYWADGTHKGELETILCGHTGDLLQKWQKKALRKAMKQAGRVAELEKELIVARKNALKDAARFCRECNYCRSQWLYLIETGEMLPHRSRKVLSADAKRFRNHKQHDAHVIAWLKIKRQHKCPDCGEDLVWLRRDHNYSFYECGGCLKPWKYRGKLMSAEPRTKRNALSPPAMPRTPRTAKPSPVQQVPKRVVRRSLDDIMLDRQLFPVDPLFSSGVS